MQVTKSGSRYATILLVEDNPSDVHLTRTALDSTSAESDLHVTRDGDDALAFLRRKGIYRDAPRPDLVLLDLNLPGKDGRQVLSEIKSDEALRQIPVIILTTSTAPSDVVACYDLHANCYIAKPVDFDEFEAIVQEIEAFWLDQAMLPSRS